MTNSLTVSGASRPVNEGPRLEALRACRVMDTPPEAAFDDLTRLAARICNTPIALVSLIDGHRQWFKSRIGLEATETPREVAFCTYTILGSDAMVVPDAAQDERFATNPLVTGEPQIRFYAGYPLINADGHGLGALRHRSHATESRTRPARGTSNSWAPSHRSVGASPIASRPRRQPSSRRVVERPASPKRSPLLLSRG